MTRGASLRSSRWCLRVLFWVLEKVAHAACTTEHNAAAGTYQPYLKPYKSKSSGRKKLACHPGAALVSHAIECSWEKGEDGKCHDESKPEWMPKAQTNGVYWPCDCGICFFCKNKLTCGIAHGKLYARPKQLPPCSPVLRKLGEAYSWCAVCTNAAQAESP